MEGGDGAETDNSFVLISNVPPSLHTCDIRKFFSDFVETEKFSCFHYRHRPEKGKVSEDDTKIEASNSVSFSKQVCGRVHTADSSKKDRNVPNCCIVKLSPQHVPGLVSQYHRKHWLDSSGDEMTSRCFVFRVKISDQETVKDVRTEDSVSLVRSELGSLAELRPPNLMPRGNVGTSTKFFLQAIKECRLPARLVGKLKLEFPQTRNRKFGNVPYDYGPTNSKKGSRNVFIDRRILQQKNKAGPAISEVADEDPDNDTCEEWERHEALHNDVQANRAHGFQVESTSYYAADADLEQQEGTKEATFEGEIELVWEKGGSGLNFYTDAQFWKEKEGDFDEKTSDDWDVDMNVYYEKNTTHDKDAVDSLDMRKSDFLREGKHTESLFRKKSQKPTAKRKRRLSASSVGDRIGSFEASSRGFGGKIMAQAGWKPGDGLGKKKQGISTPILGEEEGQGPADRSGVGFHGDQVVTVFKRPERVPHTGYKPGYLNTNTAITTAFSSPEEREAPERFDRSQHKMYLKFRDPSVRFFKGGVQGGSDKK